MTKCSQLVGVWLTLMSFFSAICQAQTYNVKTFGALGNGIQDDRPFIQSAIDKANADGVRAAIEIHGTRQYVYNNNIDGYWIGINVTANATINSFQQRYFNNTMHEVATGFLVWSDFSSGNTNLF